jgi:DedD protein
MEKKTKHRILGVLVIIGLIVILLPFFQSEHELSSETTLVKAPPFPGQSVQLAANDSSQAASYDPEEQQTAPATTPNAPATKPVENNVNQQPDDTISKQHNAVVTAPQITDDSQTVNAAPAQKPQPIQETNAASQDAGTQLSDDVVQVEKPQNKSKSVKKTTKQMSNTEHSSPVDQVQIISRNSANAYKAGAASVEVTQSISDNGLFSLKNAVWVIQMGSFKNKVNALRVVNRLRASGYPAFIQKMSTTFGESTRVFVGPKANKDAANALAKKIDAELNLHGIVVSYKPLTL